MPTNPIETILRKRGPSLSSTLYSVLQVEYGLSRQAARQRLARRPDSIRQLNGLPFPHNARFVFLKQQYGSPSFWNRLVEALQESGGGYARAIAAIHQRGGIVPAAHFAIASGAPLKQTRQLTAATIRERLLEIGLLTELDIPGIGTCLAFAKGFDHLETPSINTKARLMAESIMLNAIKSWARNLGLGSYDQFQLRDEKQQQPRVASFEWDITAPSYLGAIAHWASNGNAKPGFIVFDVMLGHQITETGLKPFIHKCHTLRSLPKVGRCIEFFVANGYTPEALHLAKKFGIVPATPSALFGEAVAASLIDLVTILTDTAEKAVDPEKLERIFNSLSKIEGATNTLRGALFEYVVADIVRKNYHAQIKMNAIYRAGGQDVAEVDVRGVVENKCVYFIECKGYLPGRTVEDTEIEKWLTKRVPFLRKQALAHPEWKNMKYRFELWTTGELSDKARGLVENAKQTIREDAYSIEIKQAQEIENLAIETSDKPLLNILRQHFLKSPLADAIEHKNAQPEHSVESDWLP